MFTDLCCALLSVFNIIDADHSGSISLDELHRYLLYFTERQNSSFSDTDDKLPTHEEDKKNLMNEFREQCSIDQHKKSPGGFNMAADMVRVSLSCSGPPV